MKKTTILFVIGILLWVFMAGANLFAAGATECYARLGNIPNASVTVNSNWTYLIPIQMKVTCDFDINLQYIQGPAGMTFDGSRLHWTPTYAQLGQTFPVTVRLTVTYDNPYKVVVTSKTFYLTVVECPNSTVFVTCSWYNSNNQAVAQVWVQNNTSCSVTTSGIVRIKTAESSQWVQAGTWSNITMGPNSTALVWGKSYDYWQHDLNCELTYSSYTAFPLVESFCSNY